MLGKTLGVPLFQEQAMRIAIVAAGFTPSEADELRRAMATFKRVGTIGTFTTKMIEGMVASGYPREFAERCFQQIEGFGTYGFPESHAASFALLVYASAWMKCRYPDVFASALLNAQPMGFYAPAQIIRDARDHGVEVREVDVNLSNWDNRLEPLRTARKGRAASAPQRHEGRISARRYAVRIGLRQMKGLREEDMEQARRAPRRRLRFRARRLAAHGLSPSVLGTSGGSRRVQFARPRRRDALWAVRGLTARATRTTCRCCARRLMRARTRRASAADAARRSRSWRITGICSLSLKAHPVSFLRQHLAASAKCILPADGPGDDATHLEAPLVTVAGPGAGAPASGLRARECSS